MGHGASRRRFPRRGRRHGHLDVAARQQAGVRGARIVDRPVGRAGGGLPARAAYRVRTPWRDAVTRARPMRRAMTGLRAALWLACLVASACDAADPDDNWAEW